jgi:uncharacterized protein YmfQ (DUF2313 family)
MAGNDTYTKSLLHFDGSNGSTTFTDSNAGGAAKTWTAHTATLATAQKKFGAASGFFNGSAYIDTPDHADWHVDGDYTIDLWVYPTSATGGAQLVGRFAYFGAFSIYRYSSDWYFYSSSNRTSNDIAEARSLGSVTLNTWQHLQVVRSGNTYHCFNNGIETDSWTSSLTPVTSSDPIPVGGDGVYNFTGYIDEFRFSKGIARNTSDFTPPTAPYSSSSANELSAAGLAVSAPVLDTSALKQKHIWIAAALAAGSPVLGAPGVIDELPAASSLENPAAVLGAPELSQTLAAADLAAGAPVLGSSFLHQIWSFRPIAPGRADRHVRRGGDDYADALAALLPPGLAWPREPETVLMTALRGLAQVFGFFDSRAADLLERESDPRRTVELLPDWERNWGLPDPCIAEPLTIADRQIALVTKMTLLGGQSRQFFVDASARIGYKIRITEYAPFMCGVSRCGDTRDQWGDWRWEIGPPEMRFYWTVHIDKARLSWFRASSGQAGVDPHLRIGIATDLECLLRRWKPGHSDIVFDYSGLATGGSMAGTP